MLRLAMLEDYLVEEDEEGRGGVEDKDKKKKK